MTRRYYLPVAILILWFSGCSHIGPPTVPRDRFDYNTAIADSWKEQTLLNIVKLRYADMPLFVEVASVVSGYTMEGSVNLNGTVSSESAVQGDFLALGTTGKYTDRPTITYAPITGAKFNENFMTPIPPKAILFMTQSGWSAEMIFPVVVESINGLRSRKAGGIHQREGDPEYYELVKTLTEIEQSGAVSMRIIKENDQRETTVLFFHSTNIKPETLAAIRRFKSLLGLEPDARQFTVTYGPIPKIKNEMAILTRSILQIMVDLSTQIQVPAAHVADGRTTSSLAPSEGEGGELARLISVNCTESKPKDPFTAVKYEDHWFWIDKTDFRSKRTFTFLMVLFSLTETGGGEGLPLVTIPAG